MTSVYPASKKQLTYIEALKAEVESIGERIPHSVEEMMNQDNLLNTEASIIIDDLKCLLGWSDE